jgi:hypothetical protein
VIITPPDVYPINRDTEIRNPQKLFDVLTGNTSQYYDINNNALCSSKIFKETRSSYEQKCKQVFVKSALCLRSILTEVGMCSFVLIKTPQYQILRKSFDFFVELFRAVQIEKGTMQFASTSKRQRGRCN